MEESKPKKLKTTEKVIEKKEAKKTVMFRQRRKFDLHVGRDTITFLGREEKRIPASWIEHKDFKQVAYLFIVR